MSDIPNPDLETQAPAPQVGGHPNSVVAAADDSLLVKAALPVELQFYQAVASSAEPEVDALRPFIPKFIGTLSLEGELDTDKPPSEGSINVKPIQGAKKESIVLENLAHPFLKPNILDIKLGTILYDQDAPPDKVARMIKTAETTTSLKTGMRLTGFQVYNNMTDEAVHTSKVYGKSISAEQLPEGLARFFPIASHDAPEQGLPAALLLQILELLREDVEDIRDALAALEIRMVGASLLILYESDAVRAEEGLKWLLKDEEEEEEDSDDDEDEEDDPNKPPKRYTPYDVRLIDFAHTRFAPGQGPDEGALLGFKTLLALLDERIAVVGACV
ncbi:Kinase [Mycena sanguinolenta]|uniref:Kinase n=1 Tax=Mycena sanguinolenta TaxID=230812 RepID=A0A8H6XXZ9_9AGAR|nr:Kinase [Mycena sanguinolenta]